MDFCGVNQLTVGIVGCGHLGQGIALSLIQNGFPKEKLMLSYRGNPATYQQLKEKGLVSCLCENQTILEQADILLLTVKPQDMMSMQGNRAAKDALIVSCAAGLPISLLQKVFSTEQIYRMMLSGPDTILEGKGVAAIYPEQEVLARLLDQMRVQKIPLSGEADLNVFSAAVCLPAAMLQESDPEKVHAGVASIGKEYPMFLDLYDWAKQARPSLNTQEEIDAYIAKMATKGGITEAIGNSLKRKEPFADALHKGIERGIEISAAVQNALK